MNSLFNDIFGEDEDPQLTVLPSRRRGRRITPIDGDGGGSETRNSNRKLGRTAGGLDEGDPYSPNTESKSALDNPYSDYKDQQLKDLTTNLFSQMQQDPSNQKNLNALNNVRKEQASRIENAKIEERMDENPNFTGRMGADGLSMGRTRGRDITDKNVEYPAPETPFIERSAGGRYDDVHDSSTFNTTAIQPNSAIVSAGASEDTPTYTGKSHITGVVAKNIVDGISDVLTEYLLNKNNNRRRLREKDHQWVHGPNIPTVANFDPSIEDVVKLFQAGGSFAVNPTAAATGFVASYVKSKLDMQDGTNPFEELSNIQFPETKKKMKALKNIGGYRRDKEKWLAEQNISNYRGENDDLAKLTSGLYEGAVQDPKNGIEDVHITKNFKSESVLKKAAAYILAEALGETHKVDGHIRLTLASIDKKEEYTFIKSTVVAPYIILCLMFYKALHEETLDISKKHGILNDFIYTKAIKYILNILGFDEMGMGFALNVLMKLPQELITAFQRNILEATTIKPNEVVKIEEFVEYIRQSYRQTFKNGYYDDVKLLQGKSMDLVGMMNRLASPHVLHLFAIQLQTADDIVWEASNNQGLFLGLIELASIHSRGTQDEGGGVGSNYNRILEEETFVIGYINYNYNNNKMRVSRKEIRLNKNLNYLNSLEFGLKNDDLIAITNSKKKSALFRDGKNIVVALAGSKFKHGIEKGDLINEDYEANLENIAGSQDFFKTEKYQESEETLKKAIIEAKKTGGKVTVVGYSLGAMTALQLGAHYPDINVEAYEPVVGLNEQTDRMFKEIENRRGIQIYRVGDSSISKHLIEAQQKYRLNIKTIKQTKFSSHSLRNFI